jgi:hypothetical protein
MNLGGAMFWSMALDDFRGNTCNEGKFPLINAAKDVVNGQASSTRPTIALSTSTTSMSQSSTAASYCLNCKLADRVHRQYTNDIFDNRRRLSSMKIEQKIRE